ncbi:TPA: hypothetical protein PTW06_000909 [Clostridium botulinum]|nr:hypothetical protein [Clostridium botulinum]HDK7223609.1 hypothetical protein [Clostridium botulinum]HDK7271059.1 hypothetical protein [Clostridium botulinum]HDK7304415.1 hypothetical protein [Clostridium botulinum]
MQKYYNLKLDLEFFTPDSIVFSAGDIGKSIEIHIHLGKYKVIYITIIILDRNTIDKKSLGYISALLMELEYKLCSIVGFSGNGIEMLLHINFNSVRINFPPLSLYGEEYKDITNNIPQIIIKELKRLLKANNKKD